MILLRRRTYVCTLEWRAFTSSEHPGLWHGFPTTCYLQDASKTYCVAARHVPLVEGGTGESTMIGQVSHPRGGVRVPLISRAVICKVGNEVDPSVKRLSRQTV